jgi:hypothetical protein
MRKEVGVVKVPSGEMHELWRQTDGNIAKTPIEVATTQAPE